jgi:hypothetical protein
LLSPKQLCANVTLLARILELPGRDMD